VPSYGWEMLFLILALVSIYPRPVLNRYFWRVDERQSAYPKLIDRVKNLPGKVVSPEDPTISLMAGKGFVWNVYLEWDRSGWKTYPPLTMKEARSSEYLVDTQWWQDILPSSQIRELDFEAVESIGPYVIWRKVGAH
jgi:hypothetical protein